MVRDKLSADGGEYDESRHASPSENLQAVDLNLRGIRGSDRGMGAGDSRRADPGLTIQRLGPVDWRRVLLEIRATGVAFTLLANVLEMTVRSLHDYAHAGVEPGFAYGERIVQMWEFRTGKPAAWLPRRGVDMGRYADMNTKLAKRQWPPRASRTLFKGKE
jgi:hypothetical protein